MKSGLYACAGASATASAAAWAKRFDEPITNESNVYFGLMLAASPSRGTETGYAGAAAAACGGGGAASGSTTSRTRRSRPAASFTAAPIRTRKCPSIHSRAKSFGTARTNASSPASTAPTWLNQFRKVWSFSASRNRVETSTHRSSAVGSLECSTRPQCSSSEGPRRWPTIAASSGGLNEAQSGPAPQEKRLICRVIEILHTSLHRCGKSVSGSSLRPLFPRLFDPVQAVDKRAPEAGRLYSGAALGTPGSLHSFEAFEANEADLSAERAQAEAEARLPCPDVNPGRPRDPEAPSGQGAQAP